jgi:hypothetical protein
MTLSRGSPGTAIASRTWADQFHAKPAEVRLFLRGALDAERTRELSEKMRIAGPGMHNQIRNRPYSDAFFGLLRIGRPRGVPPTGAGREASGASRWYVRLRQ